jgi:hypothetical protein
VLLVARLPSLSAGVAGVCAALVGALLVALPVSSGTLSATTSRMVAILLGSPFWVVAQLVP